MIENVKCECGHVNPVGTEICESCGKPFDETHQQLLNMRYEGVARRSQTYKKNIIDHIWNFFSSVKVGVWLIALILIASMFGSIYPQVMYIPQNVDPLQFYEEKYGASGYYYALLGLHQMYSSWWFVSLLTMLGISLVICSLDRVVPLYRALKTQRVTRHLSFLLRQRIHGKEKVEDTELALQKGKEVLHKLKYKVREEEHAILGEKGRFSRWGPYVNHIGLIIFLIGILIRILPGFQIDDFVWVRDGERVPVQGTNGQFYIQSEGFHLETYNIEDFVGIQERIEQGENIVKEFRTDAILYEQVEDEQTGETILEEVKRHTILVNSPLEYQGLKLFQSDFILNELNEFTFAVTHKETGEVVGKIQVNLHEPEPYYPLENGFSVELIGYFPDFEIAGNEPTTKSSMPNNPAFIFNVITPNNPDGEKSWVIIGQTIETPGVVNEYAMKMVDVKFNSVSGLMVRKDISLPVIFFGAAIAMIGLVMGFYWNHRRIWIQREGSEIWIAAHTNKNWFGLKIEVENVLDHTGLTIDKDSLEKEDTA